MTALKTIVCLKQVPDPEGPPSAFKVDSAAKRVIPVGIPPVISPFDENALEAALKLKDRFGGTVVALSLGARLARPVLRKALNVGADELIFLEDEHFEEIDSSSTAYTLAAAIRKIGNYSLILTGRQAADWDFGETGHILAEILEIPAITLAQRIEVEDTKVVVQKLRRGGYENVRATMPALVTVTNEIGALRSASLRGIKDARDKPLKVWGMEDFDIDPQKLTKRQVHGLAVPGRARICTLIEGISLEEKGEKLALKLREDKLI